MKKYIVVCAFAFALITHHVFSQPLTDIISFNCQTYSSPYKNNTAHQNKTTDYFLSLFFPKVLKNGNTFLFRANGELMNSAISSDSSYSSTLYQLSLPTGFQFISPNQKWKTVIIGIPKIATETNSIIDKNDYQFGGIFLENFTYSNSLKIKFGLYYNREAFGSFFMPLAGLDWKVSDRLNLYGIMPSSYKVEYMLKKNRVYTGIHFKSFTRSFRLPKAQNYDYVRYNEIQLRYFIDYFVYKKLLLIAEVGYSLGRNPWQYTYGTKTKTVVNPIYTATERFFAFNVGIAYRLRFDLQQQ